MTDLTSRTALVTGASRGIGRAIVRDLLDSGADVVATARGREGLEKLKELVPTAGDKLRTIAGDLSTIQGIEALCNAVEASGAQIDILVNNAAVFHFTTLEDTSNDILEETYSVNVFAPFILSRCFVGPMIDRAWGRVINICSSSAYSGGGTPKHCVYSSSKHALLGFSRALDEEVRSTGVRVGTVSPAGVDTDMIAGRKDLDSSTFMSPEEVSRATMYLVRSESPGIVYEMRLWRMNR